jgi:hypothetical protein
MMSSTISRRPATGLSRAATHRYALWHRLERPKREVDSAFVQLRQQFATDRQDPEADARRDLARPRNQLRDQQGAKIGARRQGEGAHRAHRIELDRHHRRSQPGQAFANVGRHSLRPRGWLQGAAAPKKEGIVRCLTQPTQRVAHRGLRQVEPLRRPCRATQVVQGLEHAQQIEIEKGHEWRS